MVRENLAWALRVDLGWYTALWLLAVAGASASSIAIEREEDTWVSLTSTPLTGWQIVRGKVFGAIWNQRGFAAVLGFIWLLGLLTAALQPDRRAGVDRPGRTDDLAGGRGRHPLFADSREHIAGAGFHDRRPLRL